MSGFYPKRGAAAIFSSGFMGWRNRCKPTGSQLSLIEYCRRRLLVENGGMSKFILIGTLLAGFGCASVGAADQVDFVKDIQPILQKSCVDCHGAKKSKGKLRLDSNEAALKGGGDGVVIVPGKADQSDLYRRITLPADNDDVMPSKGDLLTKAQTDLIRDWINQGAVWPNGLVLAAGSTAADAPSEEAAPTPPPPNHKPSAAELKAIKTLTSLGVAVQPIAVNLNWQQVNFRAQAQDPKAIEAALVPLSSVLGLVELNLGGAQIKDADLSQIEGLTNLHRLHLENTPVTDAGLAHLKGLVNLTYLNLYGTAITDSGLEQLRGLTQLKNLYLWQTKTTEAGVANLKQALPNLDISTGVEWKQLANKEEKADEKKEEKK